MFRDSNNGRSQTALILRRREAPSRRMASRHGLAAILRDARILRQALRSALLRMRFVNERRYRQSLKESP